MPGSEIQVVVRLVDQVSRAAGKVQQAVNKLVTSSEKAGQGGVAIEQGAVRAGSGLDKLSQAADRTAKRIQPIADGATKTAAGVQRVGEASARAGQQTQAFSQGLAGLGKNLTSVGLGLTTIGAGLTAAVAGPIKIAADFQKSMSAVQAISGATAEEFDKLKMSAMELGATTIFTARQVADAQRFMAMAGLNAAQILGALPAVLDLAAAGNLDLARAADIVTNILTAYGLEVSDLGHAVDVLVATFTSANTNLEELGDAFKFVAPVAAALGVPLEQTAAALGLLANAGLKATLAGTTLRGALTQLLNPSKQDQVVLDELGIVVNDAAGNFVGFAKVIEQFQKSGAKANQVLQVLGQRAGPGLQALVSVGAEAMKQFEERLKLVDGISRRIAQTMTDNVYGASVALSSALEGLAITIGDPLLNATQAVLRTLTDLVRGFNNVYKSLGPIAPVLTVVIGALGVLITSIGAATLAWSFFGKGLTQVAALLITLVARITGSMIPALAAETVAVEADAAAQGVLATALSAVNVARLAAIAGVAAAAVGIAVLVSAIYESIKRRREEIKSIEEAKTKLAEISGSYEDAKNELARLKAEGIKATDLTGKGFIKLRDNVAAAKDELLLMKKIKLSELEQQLDDLSTFAGADLGAAFDDKEAVANITRLRGEVADLDTQIKDFDQTVKDIKLQEAFDPGAALARIDILVNRLNLVSLKAKDLPGAFKDLGTAIGTEMSKVLPQFDEDLSRLDARLRQVGAEIEKEIDLRKIGRGSEARFKELEKEWTDLNNNIKKITEQRDRFIEGSIQRYSNATKTALNAVAGTYEDLAKEAEKSFAKIARSAKSTFQQQINSAATLVATLGAQFRGIQGEVVGALTGISSALDEISKVEAGLGKAAGLAQLQQALRDAGQAGIEAFTQLQAKVESTINAILQKEEQLASKIRGFTDSIRGVQESAEEARLGIIRRTLTEEQKLASFQKEAQQTLDRLRAAAAANDLAGVERYGSKAVSIAQQLAGFKGQEQAAIAIINEQERVRTELLEQERQKAEEQRQQWEQLRTSLESINQQITDTVDQLKTGLQIQLDKEQVKGEIDAVREDLLKGGTLKVDADTAPAQAKLIEIDGQLQIVTDPKVIPVAADTIQATTELESVKSLLDSIKSKTVTVTVNTVQRSQEGGPVGWLRRLAGGGGLPGYGGGDRIRALLEPGEWVIRKEAVKRYGEGIFAALNSLKMPRLDVPLAAAAAVSSSGPGFQTGGPVGGDSKPTVNLTLHLGRESFPLQGEGRIVDGLIRRLRREARVTVG
jgi:TP901 family phage tail tape measure protein